MGSIIKVSRPINHFIVHCAFTKPNMDIDADVIDRWHRNKGWSEIGYNFFVKRDGTVEDGRSLKTYGAHTLGRNRDSIGICYAGGMGMDGSVEDNITPEQMASILDKFREARVVYPGIKISGHNQHNKKACPSFDMREYARKHGVEESAIYQRDLLVKF